jgi:uncharacterized protein
VERGMGMYPQEYISYLAHFHGDRDYFECHEILEDYWKHVDPGNKDSIWVGLIQLAVSCYHHRRGNFNGAKRTLEKSLKIFSLQDGSLTNLGLDKQLLIQILKERLPIIEKEKAYTSFNLPLCNPLLIEDCIKTSEKKGFTWENVSDLTNISLVHRHKLRDRTSVINNRSLAIKNRRDNK